MQGTWIASQQQCNCGPTASQQGSGGNIHSKCKVYAPWMGWTGRVLSQTDPKANGNNHAFWIVPAIGSEVLNQIVEWVQVSALSLCVSWKWRRSTANILRLFKRLKGFRVSRSRDRASWYISIVKPTRRTIFSSLLNITLLFFFMFCWPWIPV